MFSIGAGEVVIMQDPTDSERRQYFERLLVQQTTKAPSTRKKAGL